MSKMKQEQFYLWRSIVPQLRKNIEYCIKELKQKSVLTLPPEQFEERKHKIKSIIQSSDTFDEQQFFDIFAFIIQEKLNLSLLQLSDLFANQFGKEASFWTTKIPHWANMMTFTNSFVIWTVTQFMRSFINYATSPLQRHIIYQWRSKVQTYLQSMQFLIRKIQKIKKTDTNNAYSIDEAYFKYHNEKVLYTTFMNKLGLKSEDQKSLSFDQVSITFRNKSKAQKKLFNFPHATKTLDSMESFGGKNSKNNTKKSVNTLQKYNFFNKVNSKIEAQLNQVIGNEQKHQINRKKIIETLQKIGKKNSQKIEALRQQLKNIQNVQRQKRKSYQENLQNSNLTRSFRKMQSNNSQNQPFKVYEVESFDSSELKQYPMNHATFIHNIEDYFSFEGKPIGYRGISVSNPFIMFHWINYFINDQEEYQQMMAYSIGDSNQDNLDSETDSQSYDDDDQQLIQDDQDFIDYRLVVTSDNVDFDKLSPEDRINFAQLITEQRIKWVADYKCLQGEEILSSFLSIPVYGSQLPYFIQNTDDPKTKKRALHTKEKYSKSNECHSYQIQVINQSIEEDSTNQYKRGKQQHQVTNKFNQKKSEENSIFQMQTTFGGEKIEQNQNKSKDWNTSDNIQVSSFQNKKSFQHLIQKTQRNLFAQYQKPCSLQSSIFEQSGSYKKNNRKSDSKVKKTLKDIGKQKDVEI